jgi:hypothetical protein
MEYFVDCSGREYYCGYTESHKGENILEKEGVEGEDEAKEDCIDIRYSGCQSCVSAFRIGLNLHQFKVLVHVSHLLPLS